MTKPVTIEIDEQMHEFIGEQISHGQYGSINDVILAGLRLLRHKAELEAIEAAIAEGEASGEPVEFDFDEFLERKQALRGRQ